jgi:hypothetical protein
MSALYCARICVGTDPSCLDGLYQFSPGNDGSGLKYKFVKFYELQQNDLQELKFCCEVNMKSHMEKCKNFSNQSYNNTVKSFYIHL